MQIYLVLWLFQTTVYVTRRNIFLRLLYALYDFIVWNYLYMLQHVLTVINLPLGFGTGSNKVRRISYHSITRYLRKRQGE